MNHCWAAAISSLSQWLSLSLFSRCLILPSRSSDPSLPLYEFLSPSISPRLFFQVSQETAYFLLLFIARICSHIHTPYLTHTLTSEGVLPGECWCSCVAVRKGEVQDAQINVCMHTHTVHAHPFNTHTHTYFFLFFGIVQGQILCQPLVENIH